MLILKWERKERIKYYRFPEEKSVSLKENVKFSTEIEDGDVLLTLIDNKWFVQNNTNKKVKYGHGKLGVGVSKILKYNKTIKINDIKISCIEYKERTVKQISPGLAASSLNLTLKTEYTIGRSKDCDIVIDNPQIDKINTRIIHDGDVYYIEDLSSANGLTINGEKVKEKILEDYDTITLPGAVYMLIGDALLQSGSDEGIRIDVRHISKKVKDFNTHKYINLIDDVSFTVKQGEYVAIVGGSGAGKSTLLDCVNGRRPMTSGQIYYDLNNYYQYFNAYQKIVGYVPQSDIMHNDLSVYKILYYYAQIRMHHHLDKKELNELVLKTLDEVSLTEKKDVLVSSLSGGQKKRVSIAMELLANPKVIFLDEPTSGLSPDLDYELMNLLKELSDKGKTIIIITHNMENVDKCDKIAFLGKGGKLCYFGKPKSIFRYFGAKKYGEIFSMLTDNDTVDMYVNKLKETKEYQQMIETQNDIYSILEKTNEKPQKPIKKKKIPKKEEVKETESAEEISEEQKETKQQKKIVEEKQNI